jgi:hypothetical protein
MDISKYNTLVEAVKQAREEDKRLLKIQTEANENWKKANAVLTQAEKELDGFVRASMSLDVGRTSNP